MEGANATNGLASPGSGEVKSAGARVQDVKVAHYLEELKPKVLAAFENDQVASLPRPELAVRIGQIVTTDTEQEALNLLDRRNLVGGLIQRGGNSVTSRGAGAVIEGVEDAQLEQSLAGLHRPLVEDFAHVCSVGLLTRLTTVYSVVPRNTQ